MDDLKVSQQGADDFEGSEIAIIGMSCRLPGTSDLDTFWRFLKDGIEPLTRLSDEELREAGVPESVFMHPNYVRRMPVLEGIEDFDARFFGYTPLEVTIMDPQHRLFLECAWEAFEQAGYDPSAVVDPVGVFTGSKTNTYLFNVVAQRDRYPGLDNFQIALGNDLAAMATRVSYKFDLRGPSYALHTACSTSLVAVHLACQSLLLDECSMALAGGAAINIPQKRGYPYMRGGLLSPDGSCRTFDANAAGSNFGNGVGAVLLKRLEDAIADRDHIYAVIRGSATNNDGAAKASFTAPGAEGQTAVLLEAMACAGISAEDISYIEAHGTATELGDSIEVSALKDAFSASTEKRHFCALGSAKTNLGHLETAAGVAGLIKTVLALEQRELPPSLHFEEPGEHIDLESSPFYVNTEHKPWPASSSGRRIAGVSSFGIGSTNAHVLLEEPPTPRATDTDHPWQLLPLSALSSSALDQSTDRLGTYLNHHSELALADVSHTLQIGRRAFPERRALVFRDREEAVDLLAGSVERAVETLSARSHSATAQAERGACFLFPGLGEHFVDMGLGLYQREPAFRASIDHAAEVLKPRLGLDLREVLFPRGTDATEKTGDERASLRAMLGRSSGNAEERAAAAELDRALYAQPALFALEVALARLFIDRGVQPKSMIGYSLGEYVCACLSGVLSLEDALALVAERARLIEDLPEGGMLAVPLSEPDTLTWLDGRADLWLAAVNGVTGCVVAGDTSALDNLALDLAASEIATRRLATRHAFHTPMMDGIADALTEFARTLTVSPPEWPYFSNPNGTWITAEDVSDPAYWARHLCSPVRFADGLHALLEAESEAALLEVGPGSSLSSFARLDPSFGDRPMFQALRGRHGGQPDAASFLKALGGLWTSGVEIDWQAHRGEERRRRVPLPTYPFERQRYWVEADEATVAQAMGGSSETQARKVDAASELPASGVQRIEDPSRWSYRAVWEELAWPESKPEDEDALWLLVAEEGSELAAALAESLTRGGARVAIAEPGASFARLDDARFDDARLDDARFDDVRLDGSGRYRLRLDEAEDFEALFKALKNEIGKEPERIVHLCQAAPGSDASDPNAFRQAQKHGFYSLAALAKALGGRAVAIDVVASGLHRVSGPEGLAGDERLVPERSPLLGAAVVIPQELPRLAWRLIDLDLGAPRLVEHLQNELSEWSSPDAVMIAHREGRRFRRDFEPLALPAAEASKSLRTDGVHLLLGGLGSLGLELAEYLVEQAAPEAKPSLVLTRRTPLPESARWDELLADPSSSLDAKTRHALERVRSLETSGAEVRVAALDLSDAEALGALLDETCEQWGKLHGIFHLAGLLAAESFEPLAKLSRNMAERHFAPKAYGLYALEQALASRSLQPDFCMLFSSISAILGGGLGSLAYASANAFMDAFAEHRNTDREPSGTAWRSIGWDSWREAGHKSEESEESAGGLGSTLSELALSPEEGHSLLPGLLSLDDPRSVVISTADLTARFEQWIELLGQRGKPSATGQAVSTNLGEEEFERRVTRAWKAVLGRETIGREENFFDIGGNSLLGLQLVAELNRELEAELSPVDLFEAPTIAALVRLLAPKNVPVETVAEIESTASNQTGDIAIIGMSGRFPGASSVEAFWDNLKAGVESITFFDDEELLAAGVDPKHLADPAYVPARPILDQAECFDAGLFGYSPREAELMDPQHRVFLECAWAALEDAGYDPDRYPGSIGVFAGSSLNTYLLYHLLPNFETLAETDPLQAIIGADKDSLTTNVSYRLNLRGPSLAVQTYCSTALVAVHLGVMSLRKGECDMVLAGAASISMPQAGGYVFQEASILSRDGHCRPFDAHAGGTLFGNGVGSVVLKRLEDALRDGDTVHAVIRGSAINNDGSLKVGYTAPSVVGQSEVVSAALRDAGVDPSTIGYVEAHGTGTALGDPIEVAALKRAYGEVAKDELVPGACALGSVKGNIGHLDRAASIASLIKAVLTVEHGEIPPTLHFEAPNPKIDFSTSPFSVNTALNPWRVEDGQPRRAGISALGFGGTNVHLILEQALEVETTEDVETPQLLLLSARTGEALDEATQRLGRGIAERSAPLADIAHTLQVGRRQLARRRFLVVEDREAALAALDPETFANESSPALPLRGTAVAPAERTRVLFLLPGQGSQYPGMTRELYDVEPTFRQELDHCLAQLSPQLDRDPRELLFPTDEKREEAAWDLADTRFTQPILFAVEYALARMWMAWGVRPAAFLGHSISEYVAACLAGVMTLDDALTVVVERGRLVSALTDGEMLSVPLSEAEILPRLGEGLSLAAVNAPDRTVVAGEASAIARLASELEADGIEHRRLVTRHAFHSSLVEPAVEPLVAALAKVELKPPQLPFLSCLSGAWITAEEATDPAYWGRQLRGAVRFAAGVEMAFQEGLAVFLEVGPGHSLSRLARRQVPDLAVPMIQTLPGPKDAASSAHTALAALGRLWTSGLDEIDWQAVHGGKSRRRVPLPTYPFERRRHGLPPRPLNASRAATPSDAANWLLAPSWKQAAALPPNRSLESGEVVIFGDRGELSQALGKRLEGSGQRVSWVGAGAAFADLGGGRFQIDPTSAKDYRALGDRLGEPDAVFFLWSCALGPVQASADGLLELLQGLDRRGRSASFALVTHAACDVLGEEQSDASIAPLVAICRSLHGSLAHVSTRQIDLALPSQPTDKALDRLARQLETEALAIPEGEAFTIALRGGRRWLPILESVTASEVSVEDELPSNWLLSRGLDELGSELALALQIDARQRDASLSFAVLEGEAPNAGDEGEEADEMFSELRDRESLRAPRVDWAESSISNLAEESGRSSLPEGFEADVNRLCAAYLGRFLSSQLKLEPGERYRLQPWRDALGVVPRFEPFFDYLLKELATDGFLHCEDDEIHVLALPEDDPEELAAELGARYPDLAPCLHCLSHCASRYGEIFRGEVDPLAVLYPDGSPSMLLDLMAAQESYSLTPWLEQLLLERLEGLAEHQNRSLRILEVGAGEGALSWRLIGALEEVEYYFTDLLPAAVQKAKRQALSRGWAKRMEFQVFDLDRVPEEQDLAPHHFDVVVARDVIHVLPQVERALEHLSRLLVPGGELLIIEPARDQRWVSMIWGLTEAWWHFTDRELRPSSPILDPKAWRRALATSFDDPAIFPAEGAPRVDHTLITARVQDEASRVAYQERASDLVAKRRAERAVRRERWERLEEAGARLSRIEASTVEAAVEALSETTGMPDGILHTLPTSGSVMDARSTLDLAGLHQQLAARGCSRLWSAAPLSTAVGEDGWRQEAGWRERELDGSASLQVLFDLGDKQRVLPPSLAAKAVENLFRVEASGLDLPWIALTPRSQADWNHRPAKPLPDFTDAMSSDALAAGGRPWSEEEKGVARIWREVLGVERLSLEDSFFDLGGDSLIATQIHARLEETWGVKVAMETLFENPTVEGQARSVAEARDDQEQEQQDKVLARLSEMSEEEALRELAKLSGAELTGVETT